MKTGTKFFFGFDVACDDCGHAMVGARSGDTLLRIFSPTALLATKDGKSLFVACATANCVLRMDTVSKKIVSIPMPNPPSGLTFSPDDSKLYITCVAPESKVCEMDVASFQNC